MPKLVSPSQTAFVVGRRGTDNFIVAQELLYSLEKKKGKTGYMIIKIDLDSAWEFIREENGMEWNRMEYI